MRRAENKEYGYIILPIVVADGVDPNVALDNDKNINKYGRYLMLYVQLMNVLTQRLIHLI